jgi:SAM-dependent methyltransferase
VTVEAARSCWCGSALGEAIGPHYRRCTDCGAAVLVALPAPRHFDVADDEHDFYGKQYWTDYAKARELPDIVNRARADLSERCVFWLERLLAVVRPPGRILEIGCGHGGFVRLLRELGFDATGTELSSWVVELARKTFDVPVLQGRIETLDLTPGFDGIAMFDVLEHVEDPLDTVRRCAALLAPDGVLLLQTPWYRGEGPDWSMFQADEHIHLFTEQSIRRLLHGAGLDQVLVQPSLFSYDMWVVAGKAAIAVDTSATSDLRLPVLFTALLDLSRQTREVRQALTVVESDRAERLAQVDQLTQLLRKAETAWRQDAEKLTAMLRESETDRGARLEQIEKLTRLLAESEADRAARLQVIESLRAMEVELDCMQRHWVWRTYRAILRAVQALGLGK